MEEIYLNRVFFFLLFVVAVSKIDTEIKRERNVAVFRDIRIRNT